MDDMIFDISEYALQANLLAVFSRYPDTNHNSIWLKFQLEMFLGV